MCCMRPHLHTEGRMVLPLAISRRLRFQAATKARTVHALGQTFTEARRVLRLRAPLPEIA